jgi:hypothetical protein
MNKATMSRATSSEALWVFKFVHQQVDVRAGVLQTAHDTLATLLGPMVAAHTPPSGLLPARGRSGGSRAQASGQRARPQLSPTPLAHMGSWDASRQGGAGPDGQGLRSGGDSYGNYGPSTSASPPIPSSPRHRQMMPHQGTPPITGSHGAPITTGVGGSRPSPVDLLGRSTPPPGAAAVTTGEALYGTRYQVEGHMFAMVWAGVRHMARIRIWG